VQILPSGKPFCRRCPAGLGTRSILFFRKLPPDLLAPEVYRLVINRKVIPDIKALSPYLRRGRSSKTAQSASIEAF